MTIIHHSKALFVTIRYKINQFTKIQPWYPPTPVNKDPKTQNFVKISPHFWRNSIKKSTRILQDIAIYCNKLQEIASYCKILQDHVGSFRIRTYSSVLSLTQACFGRPSQDFCDVIDMTHFGHMVW